MTGTSKITFSYKPMGFWRRVGVLLLPPPPPTLLQGEKDAVNKTNSTEEFVWVFFLGGVGGGIRV